MKPKILLFDLEVAPSIGAAFDQWETNVLWWEQHGYLLMTGWKWLGEDEVHTSGLPDHPSWKRSKKNDKAVVKVLWDLLNEADIVVAHNGNSFDIKVANTFFIQHGLPPVSHFQSVDTKLVAKRYFRFKSNSLDDLGEFLGLGRKFETAGKGLWRKCMQGDPQAWEIMRKYNIQDVVLLEKIYLKMRPWIKNHPNLNYFSDKPESCPNCLSDRIQSRGQCIYRKKLCRQFRCMGCQLPIYVPIEKARKLVLI